MSDVMTSGQRSALMSRIRGKGNLSTEVLLAKLFRAQRICGWRRHPRIVGRPDFVFRDRRVVIFVDGCFWHGCPKHFVAPKARPEFWRNKIEANRRRDRIVASSLRRMGWRVVRVWEHELEPRLVSRTLARIRRVLSDGPPLKPGP